MPGISTSKTVIGVNKSAFSWSSYWAQHLFNEDDLNLRLNSRSNMSLIDSIGDNDVPIYPSVPSCVVGDTGITPDANTIIACKFKNTQTGDMILGSYTAGALFYFSKAGNNWNLAWGNNEYAQSAGGADTNWHGLIIYNKKAWVIDPSIELTDAAILNVIATGTATCNAGAGATFGTATKTVFLNRLNSLAVYGGFAFTEFYIGQNIASTITWQRKFIINQPIFNTVSTYSEYVFDTLSTPNHMVCQTRAVTSTKIYYQYASSYPLKVGYSLYRREGSADIHLPYLITGEPNTMPAAITNAGYVWISDHPANAMHNLADSKLIMPTGGVWDRSDTDIWEDAARAASDYDVTAPTGISINNLNRLLLSDWLKEDHRGRIFSKVSSNSLLPEDRNYQIEIFSYNTNNTGNNFNKILQFCGDYTGYVSELWLRDPWNEVYQITALSDSEFKLNINDAIIYNKADIHTKLASVVKRTTNEDFLTTFLRFMRGVGRGTSNQGISGEGVHNPLNYLNSYPWGVCSEVALFAYNILKEYYDIKMATKPGHTMNMIVDGAFLDYRLHALVYDGVYEHATLAEILADNKIFTEPLRKTTPATAWYDTNLYTAAYHIYDVVRDDSLIFNSVYDGFKMKMLNTSTFVFPVKSAYVPKRYDGTTDIAYYGSGIMTIPAGITGDTEMPFQLVRLSGEGSVEVEGVTYDLPADESTLNTFLQTYEDLYRTFTVLTNTGGISAEYFVNHRRLFLYNKNTITKGIISGNIQVDRVKTATPFVTFPISVNKGTSPYWTILFDKYFTTNKTFKHPVTNTDDSTHDMPQVHFLGGATNPLPIEYFKQTNVAVPIVAGTAVVDKCFASKLLPRNSTFTGSLELSFETYDGSTCYYTTDGSTPDATKTAYTVPFTISATTTVKWINIRSGYANSHVNTRVITKTA